MAWNTTVSSFGRYDSSFCLRSVSQKKRASEKRARSTRSLPAMIAAPPSLPGMLAITTKCGAGLPSGKVVAK